MFEEKCLQSKLNKMQVAYIYGLNVISYMGV